MNNNSLIPSETIIRKIFLIRNHKVMIDRHLAELYEVKTKVLKQAVKRNIDRFPEDFMFELTKEELKIWRSQIVTSNGDQKGLRYPPFAFTEQGVAMLSSILNTPKAIQINIQIIRTFTRLREILLTNKELKDKIIEMEQRYDQQFSVIFETLKQLIDVQNEIPNEIGFNSRPLKK